MQRFISVECIWKKGNTFRGIPFFSLSSQCPEISVPFVHNYIILVPEKIDRFICFSTLTTRFSGK